MKFLVLFVTLLCVVSAQTIETTTDTDNNGNVIVRVHLEGNFDNDQSSDSSPFRLFRPFNMFSSRREKPQFAPLSAPEESDPFAAFFENLFNTQPTFQLLSADDDDDDDEEEETKSTPPENPFSALFTRLSSILDAVNQETVNGNFQSQESMSGARKSARRQGGCTLLQACRKDIDSVCAYAKRINIAQAIPKCLASHRPQLSDACGTYIDRFYSTSGDESSDSEISETSETVEPTIIEPAKPEPKTPQESCQAAASSFCPDLPSHNMVSVMACLYRHREEVPKLCLDHVKDTAAFNCAVDAQRFCAGITNRRAIGQCLKPHMKELAPSCVAAAHKHAKTAQKAASSTAHLVSSVKSQSATVSSSPSDFIANHSLALGLGLGGFVMLAVVGAVVVVIRKRRRTQRVRLPAVSTVQLVNPSA